MPAKPKLPPEQWDAARRHWEHDSRGGYAWLVEELALPVSTPAVRKAAIRGGWAKVETKPNGMVSETMDEEPLGGRDDGCRPPVGRPTSFRDAYVEQAYKLCLLGATDAELADFFGVSERTINTWKDEHPEFLQSIKAGKTPANANVAASLYRAAIGGGTVTETKEQVDAEGKVTRTTEVRQLPANVVAQIFWLKNREPDKWRDKFESTSEVTIKGPTEVELAQVYASRMQAARERQDVVWRERGLLGRDAENL